MSRTALRPVRLRAFTLVELLVVIGIVALLISILMPALRKARESANSVVCSSNQRQIMTAFLMFANEHKGHLPGNWWDHTNPDHEKRSWLINAGEPFQNAPQNGTLYRYLNSRDVYLCPSQVQANVGIGHGSNGRFDFASFLCFSGAKVTKIQPKSKFEYGGQVEWVHTPIVVEEEPKGGINGGNNEGGHCNTDQMAHNHPAAGWNMINGRRIPKGGTYYASIDGSVHFFKEPFEANSWNWHSQAPSGALVSLGNIPNPSWGWWNRQ